MDYCRGRDEGGGKTRSSTHIKQLMRVCGCVTNTEWAGLPKPLLNESFQGH